MNFQLKLATFLLFIGVSMAEAANPVVVLETNKGTIKVELFEDKAPVSVKNFLAYVDSKHYDGLIFHRVVPDFVIQAGGFDDAGKEKKTEKPIKNEASNGLSNVRGTLAMARTSDPDSATSQFYINLKDNKGLDKANEPSGHGYCVFGRVIEGMDVVDAIAKVKLQNKGGALAQCPADNVVIKTAKVHK
ncbi:MAG: peptidylprolyl isomerase [Zavarzinella sp.]